MIPDGVGLRSLVGAARLQSCAAEYGMYRNSKQNKQKFKVRQPQRAAKSKRPNAPSDGSKNNGIHTTKQEEDPSGHPTTDTANRSTSKQSTSRRLMGVSNSPIGTICFSSACMDMNTRSC